MKINVSAIKCFQSCQLDWYYRYVLRRVPRQFPHAYFSLGTAFHHAMASAVPSKAFSEKVEEILRTNLPDPFSQRARFIEESSRLSSLISLMPSRFTPDEILTTEQPLEYPLKMNSAPEKSIYLIGRPDKVIKLHNKWWNLQYRTLSDRTPMALYIQSRERDLHELAYARLIQHNFNIYREHYGGSLFIIIRKLSHKAIKERSHEAFVQELIPISNNQVVMAISDITHIAITMQEIIEGRRSVIQTREADLGRFGNTLNPYYEVRAGRSSITDDSLFMDAPDPYAVEQPEAQE